jgi:3',5'-cyclic AMP phosphodiesterase CpdA
VATRLIHVSDLHVGGAEEQAIELAFGELVERVGPALVVASGDLTHRGRPVQHQRAAAFLRGFGAPVLAVPGNHDIPHAFPARFTRPWREFERHWQTTEPVFHSNELSVVGLNSARPWRHQSGGLSGDALRRAGERLADAAPGALRVVCFHHHLTGAPWRSRKRPVSRRGHVLEALVDAGADLILSGHIHQSAVSERREFEVGLDSERTVTVAIAPGLGQPRPKRRGEARGLHVIDTDEHQISIETHVYDGDRFVPVAARRYPRRSRLPSTADPSREEPSLGRGTGPRNV